MTAGGLYPTAELRGEAFALATKDPKFNAWHHPFSILGISNSSSQVITTVASREPWRVAASWEDSSEVDGPIIWLPKRQLLMFNWIWERLSTWVHVCACIKSYLGVKTLGNYARTGLWMQESCPHGHPSVVRSPESSRCPWTMIPNTVSQHGQWQTSAGPQVGNQWGRGKRFVYYRVFLLFLQFRVPIPPGPGFLQPLKAGLPAPLPASSPVLLQLTTCLLGPGNMAHSPGMRPTCLWRHPMWQEER